MTEPIVNSGPEKIDNGIINHYEEETDQGEYEEDPENPQNRMKPQVFYRNYKKQISFMKQNNNWDDLGSDSPIKSLNCYSLQYIIPTSTIKSWLQNLKINTDYQPDHQNHPITSRTFTEEQEHELLYRIFKVTENEHLRMKNESFRSIATEYNILSSIASRSSSSTKS